MRKANPPALFLYYARYSSKDRSVYKIGISSNVHKRVLQYESKKWQATILMIEKFDTEYDARQAESLVKRCFRNDCIWLHIFPSTETFNRDVLGLDERLQEARDGDISE